MKASRWLNGLIAPLLFVLSGCLGSTATTPNDFTRDDLVRGFEIVAFGREFLPDESTFVVKFDRPINVIVVHEAYDQESVRLVQKTIDRIKSAPNAPTFGSFVTRRSTNLGRIDLRAFEMVVLALGPKNYTEVHARFAEGIWKNKKKVAEHFFFSRCGGRISNDQGALETALVFFDIEQMSHMLEPCIIEEMFQSLGLPDDDDSLVWSIFNDRNGKQYPGDYDSLLIAILYDEALKPGMARAEAMRLVPGIVDRLWRDYQAKRAPKA